MEKALYLAILIIVLLTIELIRLLYKNHKLTVQIQDHDMENFWHRLALTDELTGLYNRTAYSEHIEELEKSRTFDHLGIVLFDVDNFKMINDEKGHLEGDEILKFVAKSIKSVFQSPIHHVYRIGGDEFAVISRNTSERKIIELLIMLRKVMGENSDIRLSNGYSVIQGDVKAAFKNADEMLYADKASRK